MGIDRIQTSGKTINHEESESTDWMVTSPKTLRKHDLGIYSNIEKNPLNHLNQLDPAFDPRPPSGIWIST
jgi:hypothetical protein